MMTCTRCLADKLETDFPPSKQRLSGYGSQCKACRADRARARRAEVHPNRAEVPEPILQSVPDFDEPDIAGPFSSALADDLGKMDELPDRALLAQLLRIGHLLDVDTMVNPAWTLNLHSQWRAALKEAGMTPGPRRPVVEKPVAPPTLSIASY